MKRYNKRQNQDKYSKTISSCNIFPLFNLELSVFTINSPYLYWIY